MSTAVCRRGHRRFGTRSPLARSHRLQLSALRKRAAQQLRESVELPLLPTPASGAHDEQQLAPARPRAAFCVVADAGERTCELLSCAAPTHAGIGAGILQRSVAHDVACGARGVSSALASSELHSSSGSNYGSSSQLAAADDAYLAALQVKRTRLLPSEHVAATLGELRELARLVGLTSWLRAPLLTHTPTQELPLETLSAYADERMALVASLARAVALQADHDAAAAHSSSFGGAERERFVRACELLGVAPTDVPLVSTLAELGRRHWRRRR